MYVLAPYAHGDIFDLFVIKSLFALPNWMEVLTQLETSIGTYLLILTVMQNFMYVPYVMGKKPF